MVRECFLNNTGILFHSAELEELGISPASLWPVVKIPTPPSPPSFEEPTKLTSGVPPAVATATATTHVTEATGATLVDSPLQSPEPMADTIIDMPEPMAKTLVPSKPIKLGCEEDARDSLMPIYDQLSLVKWWWILELLPMRQRYQRHDMSWRSWFS